MSNNKNEIINKLFPKFRFIEKDISITCYDAICNLGNNIDEIFENALNKNCNRLKKANFGIESFYGFLDRENKKIVDSLEKIKKDSSNIAIIYESPKRIIKLLEKVSEVLNNPYVCLCNDLTKKFEKKYYGKTNEVLKELENNPNSELGEYVLLIEKNDEIVENNDRYSCESLIVDEIIKSNCTMKDAIKLVSEKYKINKNEVYNASLNLKKIFDRK